MLQVAIREDNSKALTIIAHKLHCGDIVVAQMNKKLPTLHGMYLENPTGALDLIMFLLINVTEYYNIGKTMNATQIEELAVILCENFRNWTLSDFALCFKNAKVGTYGKIYDRIDGGVITEWCNKYDSDKTHNITAWHHERKNELTIGSSARTSSDSDNFKSKVRGAVHQYNLDNFKNKTQSDGKTKK